MMQISCPQNARGGMKIRVNAPAPAAAVPTAPVAAAVAPPSAPPIATAAAGQQLYRGAMQGQQQGIIQQQQQQIAQQPVATFCRAFAFPSSSRINVLMLVAVPRRQATAR